MELRENLQLVQVEYSEDQKKVEFTFLDEEQGVIRPVVFNRQSYDNVKGKYVDDPEKAAKVDEWCQTYFGLSYDNLAQAVDTKHDIYVYDNFCSLWEAQQIEKMSEDMVGQIIQTDIKEIIVDDVAIRIRFDYDGKTYESKMTYGKYLEVQKKWMPDLIKRKKQEEKFEKKFLVPITEKDSLIGHPIMVEVKKAMGKFVYCEVKAFPKPKK